MPATNHPEGVGNEDCSVGQSGPVWYLGPSGGGDDAVINEEKNCTIPRGKFIFASIITVVCTIFEDVGTTPEELRDCANTDQDAVTILEAEIDGKPVWNPWRFRVETDPLLFDFTLPKTTLSAHGGALIPHPPLDTTKMPRSAKVSTS